MATVQVHDGNIDDAMRKLKRHIQQEGIPRKMKIDRAFESGPEKRKRKKEESHKRQRKLRKKQNSDW